MARGSVLSRVGGERIVFFALLILQLVPLCAVAHVPSQDGPVHLGKASALRRSLSSDPLVDEYYECSLRPIPNTLGVLVLSGLTSVFSPRVSEKLLAAACVLLLPLAARYALGAVDKSSGFLAVLVFPLVYNRPFQLGFYGFSLGLIVLLVFLGYWIANRDRLTPLRALGLALLGGLLHLAHLGVLAPGIASVLFLTAWFSARELRESRAAWPAVARRAAWTALALLPAAALALWYSRAYAQPSPRILSSGEVLMSFLTLNVLVVHTTTEGWIAFGVASLFLAICIELLVRKVLRRDLRSWDCVLVFVALLVFLRLRANDERSVLLFLPDRLTLLFLLYLIVWFAGQTFERAPRWAMTVAAAAITVTLVVVSTTRYLELDGAIGEYLSAGEPIAPDRTLLAVCFEDTALDSRGERLSIHVNPLVHRSGEIAAARNLVDLSAIEAVRGNNAVHFRPGRDPYPWIGQVEASAEHPRAVDIARYVEKQGGRVDYVLLWGTHAEDRTGESNRRLFSELATHYELVFTSAPGHALLYRRRS